MSHVRKVAPVASALLGAFVLTGGAARAEPAPATAPAGDTAACGATRGALAFIGCSVAQQLGAGARGASVSIVGLKSERELPSANVLKERLQSAVSVALQTASGDAKPSEPSRLRVELDVEQSDGTLRVSAELRRALGLWQRVRHEKPRSERHAFVEAPLDAELRALIPPPPLVVSEVLKLKAPERGVVALACGALGSDGGQELLLVSRSNVRVGRIAGHAFVERKKAAWATLSPVAPTPLREPIATADITAGGRARVGLTDRKDGVELSRELVVTARFEGLLPVPGGDCTARSGVGVSGKLTPCTAMEASRARSLNGVLDSIAGAPQLTLGRELGTTTPSGTFIEMSPSIMHVGAQLAVGDADSDGNPELAFSSDTLDAASDRLTLVTLRGGKVDKRFQLAAPAISAVAICAHPEGPGMAPVVVATGDELWLIR